MSVARIFCHLEQPRANPVPYEFASWFPRAFPGSVIAARSTVNKTRPVLVHLRFTLGDAFFALHAKCSHKLYHLVRARGCACFLLYVQACFSACPFWPKESFFYRTQGFHV